MLTGYRLADSLVGMAKRSRDIAAVLKAAFRRSGRSIKSVSDETGMPYSVAHGFFVDDTNIRIDTASKLAGALGVRVFCGKE